MYTWQLVVLMLILPFSLSFLLTKMFELLLMRYGDSDVLMRTPSAHTHVHSSDSRYSSAHTHDFGSPIIVLNFESN